MHWAFLHTANPLKKLMPFNFLSERNLHSTLQTKLHGI